MNLPTSAKAGYRPHPSNGPNRETHCSYCHGLLGQHKDDCVCLKRTVVVEMTIRYVIKVPRTWDEEFINFHRNDSSFCLGNDIHQLEEEATREPNLCNICQRAEVRYLREATEQDHEDMAFKPSIED